MVTITGIESFREIRIPYTEEELAELPPSIRERERREGKVELVPGGVGAPGTPFAVQRGGTLVVRVEVASAARSGNVSVGGLVFEGTVWDRTEVPIIPVTGAGAANAQVVPDRIRVALAPGHTVERDVTVHRAPVSATVVGVLDTASPHVRIRELVASRYEHREFTEEEIQELPPAMRDQARRDGYDVAIVTGRAAAAETLTVPARGMLQAYVQFSVPDRIGAFLDLSGTLIIESNAWRRIEIPISPVAGAISLAVSTDHIELRQGEEIDGPSVDLRSIAGPPTEVLFDIGFPGDPWSISPQRVSLAQGASTRVLLRLAATLTAATGKHRVGLQARWFDGLGI